MHSEKEVPSNTRVAIEEARTSKRKASEVEGGEEQIVVPRKGARAMGKGRMDVEEEMVGRQTRQRVAMDKERRKHTRKIVSKKWWVACVFLRTKC